jgi:carbon storage regulator
MLILSRKPTEQIVITGGITVTVTRIEANQVRLGIEAPGDVTVLRAELLDGKAERRRDEGRGRHAARERVTAASVAALMRSAEPGSQQDHSRIPGGTGVEPTPRAGGRAAACVVQADVSWHPIGACV